MSVVQLASFFSELNLDKQILLDVVFIKHSGKTNHVWLASCFEQVQIHVTYSLLIHLTSFVILECFFTLQKALKTEYFLWQLYITEKSIETTKAELEVDSENLMELTGAQDKLEGEIREKKKQQAVYTKEFLLCEKKMTKKKFELDKKVSSHNSFNSSTK